MAAPVNSHANRPVRASRARIERVLWTLTNTLPPATVTPAPASEEASPSSRYDQRSLKGGLIESSPETPVRPALPLYAGHSGPESGEAGAACAVARIATMQGRNVFKERVLGRRVSFGVV